MKTAPLFINLPFSGTSGHQFNLFLAKPADIHLEDIAHALSHQHVFGGHGSRFYSEAEQAIYVASRLPKLHSIYALLATAYRAYLNPGFPPASLLVETDQDFIALRLGVEKAIFQAFGLSHHFKQGITPAIRQAQERITKIAETIILRPVALGGGSYEFEPGEKLAGAQWGLEPAAAKELFIKYFKALMGENVATVASSPKK